MRTVSFQIDMEIPHGKAGHERLRDYFAAIKPQLHLEWGRMGQPFGLGFTWTTNRRVSNHRLPLVKRYLLRAMIENGIVRPATRPNVYNLEQRIKPSYGTTPKATVTLKED